VGAAIGLGCAFFLEYLDDTIKTTDDVTRLLDVETLGKIGSFSNGNGNLVISANPFSPVAEDFRVLATNIHFATLDQPIHSLVITSPSSREGKSVVLANLAVTMARSETSVVAIDGDLRLPNLHELFNLTPGDGLTGALLAGKADGKLQNVKIDGLKVLTCGKLPSNPTEVIGSTRMRELLEQLKAQSNFVLIDSPPVLPVADTTILASIAEGVVLVLRAHQTRRQAARDALQRLRQADARIIGVVLNAIPAHAEGYYGYYYHKKEKTRWWQRVPKLRESKLANLLKSRTHLR
jgi:polysaccharide biosynthesis transport protein